MTETYKSGTDQNLNVHDKSECEGEYCPIHNPSDHRMKDWPTHWRDDRGLMERICKCGVGHPDPDDLAYKERVRGKTYAKMESIHGCCGCCSKRTRKAKKK